MIEEFQGNHRFLSNFWPCVFVFDGIEYPSSEHAFQAWKSDKIDVRKVIALLAKPGTAKKAGRLIQMRSDWDQIKVPTMAQIVLRKFRANPKLRDRLLFTGDQELIEGNTWGDTFWGVCNEVGENHLGKILMNVRHILNTSGDHE